VEFLVPLLRLQTAYNLEDRCSPAHRGCVGVFNDPAQQDLAFRGVHRYRNAHDRPSVASGQPKSLHLVDPESGATVGRVDAVIALVQGLVVARFVVFGTESGPGYSLAAFEIGRSLGRLPAEERWSPEDPVACMSCLLWCRKEYSAYKRMGLDSGMLEESGIRIVVPGWNLESMSLSNMAMRRVVEMFAGSQGQPLRR